MLKGPSRLKNRRSSLLRRHSALAGLLTATMVMTTPAAVQAASLTRGSTNGPASFAANCGTKPVTLQGYFETGFPDAIDLAHLFTKQYPSVTWNIRQDPFATS
jgi:raffinose/stachyose/melibiose transport system substrate-binding protein